MIINEVITKALYDKLTSVSGIATLISDIDLGYKFWYGAAPPKLATAYPYILVSYASGGVLNDAPYEAVDVTMLVTGIDVTKPGAKALAALIDENLRRQKITFSGGWHSWSNVRQTDEFSRVETVQNAEYHQEGAYYRFRLSKGLS